jgi:hypothetical protein
MKKLIRGEIENCSKILFEKEVFKLLNNELKDQGIGYIHDLGFREFFDKGNSFGICSNLLWKRKKLESGYNDLISIFYSHELLRLKRYQYSHSIRVQGNCHNYFLQQISENNLGNVLVIYIFTNHKIKGYFFLAKGDDFDAVNKFHNDKDIFERVVRNTAPKIDQLIKKYKMNELATSLLPKHVTQELFTNSNIILNTATNLNKFARLTPKQKEVMGVVVGGCTLALPTSKNL